jgi:hypothetical protein
MPKDNGTRRMRERIAYLAARVMAEEGVDDFGVAKRKAARRAGAENTRNLPNNEEVEQALKTFRTLYQREEHAALLKSLRERAVVAMRLLSTFQPQLTGSVLTGRAGKYSDINLHLFADSAKEVEIYLINQDLRYRVAEQRLWMGDEPRLVPRLTFELDDIVVNAAIFRPQDRRELPKSTLGGKPLERAGIEWLEAMLMEPQTGAESSGDTVRG